MRAIVWGLEGIATGAIVGILGGQPVLATIALMLFGGTLGVFLATLVARTR